MNLENLGLLELNAQEVQETEGGFIQFASIVAAIVTGAYGIGYTIGKTVAHYQNNN